MTVNPNYGVDALNADKTVEEDGSETVDLYIASHGRSPRTGGPYADDIEREKAEEIRAKMEDREPDYDNPPATAGTLLVPKSKLVERDTDKSHISETIEVTVDPVDSYTVPAPVNEPDPTQPAWDNDMSKLNALRASEEFAELEEKARARADKKSDTETTVVTPVEEEV